MKVLKDYLSLNYPFVTEHLNEDGDSYWRLTVPLLPGIVAYGETLSTATQELDAAKEIWLETCLKNGITVPEPVE
ncbi:type II toxin-antitoxin system HicB family antitoxin [Levilactobacillus cerevisiae]|uniref:type II toxin-antitoxin system HicB family antitoxin n=1 Tax=Levilactobacillus cerevisiae TaxID=1704076 RepID=UPI0013DDCFF8|nr:type II toxin-antitoxin system HicB family antitoxin [Levilactobacillus cerevisiae]